VPERHGYATDLDLAGPHSLLHLINNTDFITRSGQRLTSWFLDQPPPNTRSGRSRQALIRELTPLVLAPGPVDPWRRKPWKTPISTAAGSSPCSRNVSTDSGLHPHVGDRNRADPHATGVLHADRSRCTDSATIGCCRSDCTQFLFLSVRSRSEEIFDHAQSLHLQLERLSAVLGYLERRSYRAHPESGGTVPTAAAARQQAVPSLKQAASVMNRLSVRAHPLVHYLINAVGPWDLYHTYRLQQLQDRIATIAPGWFELLAELDAAASLATFAHLHPDYLWPTLLEPGADERRGGDVPMLAAEELAHPLIPSTVRVANDIRFTGRGCIFLVTGSNMSGKSTFLRTIGINTCLAQAGGPVCAASFHLVAGPHRQLHPRG
jgi:hypothetical protein